MKPGLFFERGRRSSGRKFSSLRAIEWVAYRRATRDQLAMRPRIAFFRDRRPSAPGESGFDFAREVRGRLFAG